MQKYTERLEILERARRIARNNHPVDMIESTDEEIIEHFRQLILAQYNPEFTKEEQFYGGITDNIETNLNRHNIDTYIGCVNVGSKDKAKRIEGLLLSKLGVFIGKKQEASAGRGAIDDSTIVYLADRKAPGFKD